MVFDLINHPLPYVSFTAVLANFPIFELFLLIKTTFLDPKLMDIHELLTLHLSDQDLIIFWSRVAKKTKKYKVSEYTTDLSTYNGKFSFYYLSWFFMNIEATLNKEKVRYTTPLPQKFSELIIKI